MNSMYINRRKTIQSKLNDNEIVILFSGENKVRSNDQHYPFCVDRSFYYLTGIDESNCILVIEKSTTTLFVNKQEEVENKWVCDNISFSEASKISGINNLKENVSFDVKNYDNKTIYCDLGVKDELRSFIENKFNGKNICNIFPLLASMRRIKDEYEINQTKKAINITRLAIENMLSNVKNRKFEYEVEADFDYVLKFNNCLHSFEPIIASGLNGTILHYDKNNKQIEDNTLILCDLGAQVNKYCADITRTFPANGKFTQRQKEIYSIVLEGQKLIISKAKPGLSTYDLNNILIEFYEKKLLEIGLIKEKEDVKKYYFHGVSHQLGLDTHDIINSHKDPLEPGCIITVEPGLYIKEESIGIRIEDNILITEDGCEVLSKDIIKEIDDIENFINK